MFIARGTEVGVLEKFVFSDSWHRQGFVILCTVAGLMGTHSAQLQVAEILVSMCECVWLSVRGRDRERERERERKRREKEERERERERKKEEREIDIYRERERESRV